MLLLFTIALAVFAITLLFGIFGALRILTFPYWLSRVCGAGLVASAILLGFIAAFKFAPAIWDKF